MSKVIVESLVYHLSGKTYESRLVYAPAHCRSRAW
jgi:hypothetical protein